MKFIFRVIVAWLIFNILNVLAIKGAVKLAEWVVKKGYADADLVENLKTVKKKYKM